MNSPIGTTITRNAVAVTVFGDIQDGVICEPAPEGHCIFVRGRRCRDIYVPDCTAFGELPHPPCLVESQLIACGVSKEALRTS